MSEITKKKAGRPPGTSNRKKFSEAIEQQAEDKMLDFLNSENEKLAFDAAKFILEHNRGKAPQGVNLEGNIKGSFDITVRNLTNKDVFG